MGQVTLLTAEGRVCRGWIGVSGSAKQRRTQIRKFERAGYVVRFNPK